MNDSIFALDEMSGSAAGNIRIGPSSIIEKLVLRSGQILT